VIGAERPLTPDELAELESRIDGWLAEQLEQNPVIEAVVRDDEGGIRRWFVRVQGEARSVFTVRFELRQRNLHVETYLMPAPVQDEAELYGWLLRRNAELPDLTLVIGEEDAVYVIGQVPAVWVDAEVVDRLLGSTWAVVERLFRPAMRIGFGSRFRA